MDSNIHIYRQDELGFKMSRYIYPTLCGLDNCRSDRITGLLQDDTDKATCMGCILVKFEEQALGIYPEWLDNEELTE